MEMTSDAIVLYDCYCKLAQNRRVNKNADLSADKEVANGLVSKSSLVITRLEGEQSTTEIQKTLLSAKGMYLLYATIKARNPARIHASLDRNMDAMIREVCKWEADMIEYLRLQEVAGDRIDIKSIFEKKKYLNRLGCTFARTIVSDALKEKESDYLLDLFITDTGKRFHRADCPYCRYRELTPTSREKIKSLGLKPCKCLGTAESKADRGTMTVFVDESIRPVNWDEKGKPGVNGSYSYIICWGNIHDETQITDEMIVSRGVEHTAEHAHVDKITKAAIERVLIILAYEHNFIGRVHIFTDNKSVSNDWRDAGINGKLADLFASVVVSYVPRKKNRRADMLCGSRTILNVPTLTYKEIAKKCSRVDELEETVKKLEAQLVSM